MQAGMVAYQLPMFYGKEENFQMWWMRMRAFGEANRFGLALSEFEELALPRSYAEELDLKTTEGRESLEALDRNSAAMMNFTMAFQSPVLLDILLCARSREWPGGKACEVVTALLQRYAPNDATSKVEFTTALSKIALKPGEDPTNVFNHIRVVVQKYK